MKRLVLIRHGESQWNSENRFTGWVDVPLSEVGLEEARAAGRLLKAEGFRFDVAHTSVLKRAIKTLWTILEEMDAMWIPVHNSWRLNERMYGSLQGLNKTETVAQHGEALVKIWRRSYDIPPPPIADDAPFSPLGDPRYASLGAAMPRTECLKDTVERMIPYWRERIAPALLRGEQVVVAAHGNSLRALMKYLDNLSDDAIVELNVPTAVPIVYELDDALKPIKAFRFLGDAAAIAAKTAAVAAQIKPA